MDHAPMSRSDNLIGIGGLILFMVGVPVAEWQLGLPLWLVLFGGGVIALAAIGIVALIGGAVWSGIRFLVEGLRRATTGRTKRSRAS